MIYARGEMMAVMGPSGSGKSTLLHLLGGLDKPTGGTVLVDAQDTGKLSDIELSTLRNVTIGFVFQFFYLQPFLTVADNVAVACMPTRLGVQERHTRVAAILETVGLLGKAQNFPRQLSGGEIQRVAIARALVNRPKIVIADEPTGNLDRQNSDNVVGLLRDICAKNDTTVIIATHDEAVARVADRIIKISDGVLV